MSRLPPGANKVIRTVSILKIHKMKFKLLQKFKLKPVKAKSGISIGLDIGSFNIKMVKLSRERERIELLDFKIEPRQLEIEPGIKKTIDPKDSKRLLSISLAGTSTIVRYVVLPKMSNEELKQALKFEAQKHIPFPVAEVNLDGHILKQNLPDNKMLVLLAAAKKDYLKQRLTLMKDLGLGVRLIDLDSLALVNAFNFNYSDDANIKNQTIALLNIGAQESNLNILEDGIPRLSRDIHIGGNNFTQRLSDSSGIDFKSAEELKVNAPQDKEEQVTSCIETALTNLVKELRTSFDYYESQSVSSVSKVFLSGGGSLFKGFPGILSNLLGLTALYWDPLKKMTISDSLGPVKIKSLSAQLAVAVGLALRS